MATLKTVAISKKLVENLQSDLRHLSSEAKRKYPPVKEAAESGILKIRTITAKSENDIIGGLVGSSSDIIQPFVLGCDTRNPKIVLVCLTSVQRLIQHEAVSMPAANNLINMLWNLMEHGIEELKLLQTATLLITTNTIVQHESLAKAIVLCFRLHFNKDSITMNTAAATVRQLVSIVFERVITEDSIPSQEPLEQYSLDELKAGGKNPPKSLRPCAGDGFLLFQDLCQLVNADNPFWLIGMTEMTRTFGLELLESVLTTFPDLFHKHPEFSFLLKERVCPLVIKLFSPSIKYRQGLPAPPSPTPVEKPYFPIVMRLLRIVSILIKNYYTLLVTECEIFLSLLVKFLDGDKPLWERALALEVLHRLSIHRQLLRCFCQSYDMKMHSTKIFRDIVNALGTFIQTQFLSPPPAKEGPKTPDTQGSPPALVGGLPVGGGITPQPAFVYRGVWIPLIFTIPQGTIKPYFLEMLDKIEPPTVPEGYGITVAFHCLLDIVKSVESLIGELSEKGQAEKTPDTKLLSEQLIDSSWCGVLAAFSLLLDASTDETATESVLKSQQAYASLCGKLDMNTPRDAFITSLCKASLPPHYALTVLNIQGSNPAYHRTVSQGHTRQSSQDIQARANQDSLDAVERSQVVAVGTALPTAALPVGSQQGPVMLTAKNIQCMRAILSVAHCHGGILGTAWHMVVTTLQHLVWILGLKPSSGGSLKAGKQASESPNAVITTAAMADLPVLSAMLSRLFESSQYLDDVALHHLIDALCKLSAESMEIAYTNREPSLFAVAKLLETGLVNLPRVDVLWRPVTAHLLEVCHHPHQAMRSWGAEAVTALVKAAMGFRYDPPLHKNLKLQSLILAPLQEMSVISHPDIRQKQLECVLQILHNNGETLGHGWPLVLSVIGAVTKDQGWLYWNDDSKAVRENLIRIAFQSLSLVVTDFLPIMPCYCLQLCVEVAGKFGLQNQELNISLTSIGLLWNISDFFYQQREKIKTELAKEEENSPSKDPSISPFDALWMCVYLKLGDLCVDIRPAVRKSAGQTLFSTIAAHGDLLQQDTWQTVLWRVLFPLLDKVKKLSSSASDNRVENKTGGNILIHHSRDTAQKQWAETQVLTLAGVARVFNAKRHILHRLGDFPRAWALLLEFIESSSLCQNAEVALAALKSFQEILTTNRESRANSGSELQPPSNESMNRMETSAKIPPKQSLQIASKPGGDTGAEEAAIWSNAWRVWISIGTTATIPPPQKTPDVYLPTQPFLTALIQIFPVMFEHIKLCFTVSDLQKFSSVIRSCLAVPVKGDVTPFILPTTYLDQEPNLIPLQEAVLKAVDCIYMEVTKGPDSLQNMCPDLFDQLLTFVSYGVKPPSFGQIETKNIGVAKVAQMDWVTMNFVPFAEQSLDVTVNLYKTMATHTTVIKKCVLQNIIKTLASPLGLKYNHPSQSLWTLAINSLLTILELGLPIARKNESAFHGMWSELARTLEEFLFSKSCHPANYSVEDFQRDEALDCRVVELIRDDIFPYAQTLPKEFVMKIMNILNRGSIHSATSSSFFGTEPSVKLREEFAKACFETLLQFSFVSEQSTNSAESSVTKLAVSSLLQRCQEVLKKFVEDEKLSGKCPLPRTRMSEIAFVLKAISTLLVTLKRAPPANIEENIWSQVVQLYPSLVDCTTSSSPEVCRALKDALHQYKDLLAPPSVHNGV